MSASLASTLSLITGPALLTNASTVLLLGATNRLSIALDWQRRSVSALRVGTQDDQESVHRRAAAHRITLLRRAMLLLQAAVGSFGLGTLIAMLGLCIEQTIAPGADILANPAVLGAATIGGAALILGVMTLFFESWQFGHAPPVSHHRASSRATTRIFQNRADSPHRDSTIIRGSRKQFRSKLSG